ncbi:MULTISPECIES: hypothetical protein [Methanobacterium]|jgi:hypothetical protein|uniref:Uncharacterized protein n=1 Tax=Methanobacterium subterraneum TaxID=59277 RepID=A0A2H4VB30_9EURY|nr:MULTISPECIES: hypothetical protein [Methanobacterium]AUB55293.1 hypothetical protein BK007_04195 [Methanobacterium subterraneum]AUB57730.1 hypothetical protein BK008_04985 [Methanobacterium sp. MZ-A1]MBW4256303.1 hypothetical protein [Methanobacterium sp. YSL]NMO10200.1 hypothetical protein [Methanobacterium subterraneum]
MPPRPLVARSPFQKEIEEKIIEGKSSRYISDWLKQGENISHTAINNYRNGDFNIKAEAAKKYQENSVRSVKRGLLISSG